MPEALRPSRDDAGTDSSSRPGPSTASPTRIWKRSSPETWRPAARPRRSTGASSSRRVVRAAAGATIARVAAIEATTATTRVSDLGIAEILSRRRPVDNWPKEQAFTGLCPGRVPLPNRHSPHAIGSLE